MSLLTRALQPVVNALWRAGRPAQKPAARNFDAAQVTRLLASWATDAQSMNRQLQTQLRPLRARSRNLCQNNEYAKNFVNQCKVNIVGPHGIRLQARSKNSDGTLDELDNNAIEVAFKRHSMAGEFEASKRFDRATFERLLVETIVRDGEALVEKLPGFDNRSRFAVRMIDADYLDETYNTDNAPETGNRIRMGVEIDRYGAPVAYWLRDVHPGETVTSGIQYKRIRVEASRIVHMYLPMYADQWRGVPWMHASMIALRDLGGYREAALIAARVGAAKMGFFKGPQPEQFDGQDEAGNTVMEAEAGSFETIGPNTEFVAWDPQYPHGDFEPFNKTLLKGITAGWGISYHKGTGDLEGVNYSSGRLGELSERDMWMSMQNWFIGQWSEPLYQAWLPMALASQSIIGAGNNPLPLSRIEKFREVQWQPRRWKWTDPQKEFNGIKGNIDERLMSRSQAIRDMGYDPQDVWREIEQENAMLESMGIAPAPTPTPNNNEANNNAATDDN